MTCSLNPTGCWCHEHFDLHNYGATEYYRRLLARNGGCAVATGKDLMSRDATANFGGVSAGRSIEASIIEQRYEVLFTEDEIVTALTRLNGAGFDTFQRVRHNPYLECPVHPLARTT